MSLTMLAHFLGERPNDDYYVIQGISWGLLGLCCFWFSYVWGKSFFTRKFHRSWETSLVLCAVFFLIGLDKATDILSIWYPLGEVNSLLEGASSILFITWLIHHFLTKQIPVFLTEDDIHEVDIKYYERLQHESRITKMLKSRSPETHDNNTQDED